MADVNIQPLAARWGKAPNLYRRNCPPIFPGTAEITPADRTLALKLWRALDVESRRWYVSPGQTEFCGLPLTTADLEALYDSH